MNVKCPWCGAKLKEKRILGAGENEEIRRWEMFFFMTDTHTYMYSFNSNVDNAKDMLDVWMETFDGLYME